MFNNVTDNNDSINEESYAKFSSFLEKQCGIVLGPNKQYLVRSRLVTLKNKLKISTVSEILDKVIKGYDKVLINLVIDAMTTNETMWFRDNYPFEILGNRILPELSKNNSNIRIWSAACSSGQEPYSIAMTAYEKTPRLVLPNASKISIVGTDISDSMLEICRNGVYDDFALSRGLSESRKNNFFEKISDNSKELRVNNKLRKIVNFKQVNLLESFNLMGKFDVIFCRNVLIYFSPDIKKRIITGLVKCLNPGGYLFLGSSEYISSELIADALEMVRFNPGIAYRKK